MTHRRLLAAAVLFAMAQAGCFGVDHSREIYLVKLDFDDPSAYNLTGDDLARLPSYFGELLQDARQVGTASRTIPEADSAIIDEVLHRDVLKPGSPRFNFENETYKYDFRTH